MKKNIIILFSLFLTCLSTKPLGTWEKDTFARDDLYLDRSRSKAQEEYLQNMNLKSEDIDFYPFSVYKQLVNGINFKIFLGAQNRKSNKLELFECIVHTDLANPQFTVQGSKVLNYEATLSINNSKYNKINNEVGRYLKKRKIPMKYINSINVVPSAIYFYDIYVVSVQTQENGPKTLLLMDDDEEGLEVVADIRN